MKQSLFLGVLMVSVGFVKTMDRQESRGDLKKTIVDHGMQDPQSSIPEWRTVLTCYASDGKPCAQCAQMSPRGQRAWLESQQTIESTYSDPYHLSILHRQESNQ